MPHLAPDSLIGLCILQAIYIIFLEMSPEKRDLRGKSISYYLKLIEVLSCSGGLEALIIPSRTSLATL